MVLPEAKSHHQFRFLLVEGIMVVIGGATMQPLSSSRVRVMQGPDMEVDFGCLSRLLHVSEPLDAF